jgi:hypothetical protein
LYVNVYFIRYSMFFFISFNINLMVEQENINQIEKCIYSKIGVRYKFVTNKHQSICPIFLNIEFTSNRTNFQKDLLENFIYGMLYDTKCVKGPQRTIT